ncbi:unnamed protein product [Ixodes persulcatus]
MHMHIITEQPKNCCRLGRYKISWKGLGVTCRKIPSKRPPKLWR